MKFRTTIKHRADSSIELFGFEIALCPDESGFCTFDVPDERTDVIARLLDIPEGFAAIQQGQSVDAAAQAIVIKDPDGNEIDLSFMDMDGLRSVAKEIGLTLHHKTKADTARTQILEFLKAQP